MSAAPTVHTDSTLYETLRVAIQQFGDRDALVMGATRNTYRQLGERVDALAAGLSRLGIGPGDKVALILPVCLENLYALFALAKLGAPFVPISPESRAFEVSHILRDSDALAVITVGQMRGHDYVGMIEAMRPSLPELRHVIAYGDVTGRTAIPLADLLATGPSAPDSEAVSPDDLLGLMYTSGTTGLPKGAMHTHRSLLSQVAMVLGIFQREDLAAMLNHFPMFHLSGIASPLFFLFSGGKVVLAGHFHPAEALRLIEAERISFTVGAPITAQLMLKMAEVQPFDHSSLRVFGMGGSLCPPELIRALKERWRCSVFNGLGITEAGFVSTTRPEDPEEMQAYTVGRPAPGVEVRIVDDLHGGVPVGQVGEIACRSPLVMKGYYNRPEETAEVLDEEGWYYTGDVGSLDGQGYLRILDRKKDVINRGGESVYPAEIERWLSSNPKIKSAAVIGVPSLLGGEEVWAYVLPREGADLTEDEVRHYCVGQIAANKIPAHVRIVQSFPLGALWKVQKFKLRDEALKELDTASARQKTHLKED